MKRPCGDIAGLPVEGRDVGDKAVGASDSCKRCSHGNGAWYLTRQGVSESELADLDIRLLKFPGAGGVIKMNEREVPLNWNV